MEYGWVLGERLRPLPGEAEDEVVLRTLSRQRDQLQAQRVTALNHLREALRQYMPEVLSEKVFSNVDCDSALALWVRYPHPRQWQRLGESRLKRFLLPYGRRWAGPKSEHLVRLARRHRAGAADEQWSRAVSLWAQQVLLLARQVGQVERSMAEALAGHARGRQLSGIPGIGAVTIAALLGEMGEAVSHGERAVAAYSGLGGRVHQTGSTLHVQRRRRRVNRRLKRVFLDLAWHLVQNQAEAAAFYARRRAKGRTHWEAVRALARHLVRIVVRMLNQGGPFQRPEQGRYRPEELQHLRSKQERERHCDSAKEGALTKEKPSTNPLTRSGRVHRDPGGDLVPGLRSSTREGSHGHLPEQSQADCHRLADVRPGLR